MWPFKRKPREPEGIPWGEFVKTHLLPIAKVHGINAREMSWEEATSDSPIYEQMALAQMANQRDFVERHTPKGPLWFWEEIPNPYLVWGAGK